MIGRAALVALGALYISGVWLDGIGSNLPGDLLPRPILYFMQIATLFPNAAVVSVDYRAEGWLCTERRWVEIDTRPYFPMRSDDKENRFHRVMHFYRRHRMTLQALESYLSHGHNDGAPNAPIGGVRLLSLRIPLPKPGEKVDRYRRRSLSEHPEEQRRNWYWTPTAKRAARCAELVP